MIDIDNRGSQHQTESEEYLRARVKALEVRVKQLEEQLHHTELELESVYRMGQSLLIL